MRSNVSIYRGLLAASIIFGIAAGLADGLSGLSPWSGVPQGLSTTALLALLILSLVATVLAIAGYVGLFLCRRWGRTLSWVSLVPTAAMFAPLQALPVSGAGLMALLLGTAAWGGALAMAYSHELAPRFALQ